MKVQVSEEHQHEVLIFGITLALVMRAVFIGAALLSLFSFVFLLFGLLLTRRCRCSDTATRTQASTKNAVIRTPGGCCDARRYAGDEDPGQAGTTEMTFIELTNPVLHAAR